MVLFFRALLFFILVPFLAQAESFETVLNSPFKDSQGRPVAPKSLSSGDGKGYLLMFWAGWCVPCKEELALVRRDPLRLAQWNVIAINVDDSAGRVRAQSILKALDWPFSALDDEAGALFFQINSSGELPLALTFDPEGHLLEILRELKEPELERLSRQSFSVSDRLGWEVSEEFKYIRRDRPAGHSDVGVNTLAVKYASQAWQVGGTHNLIRQRQDPAKGWTRFEDELGPSYLQWQSLEGGLVRARLGDDYVEWGKGALLSARAIPGTEINASLLGGHFQFTRGGFALAASAGKVRQQLFGLLLDPTVDQTEDLPEEEAYGLTLQQTVHLREGLNLKVGVGGLGYHRDALSSVSTTYLNPYTDRRLFLNLGLEAEKWGFEASRTGYFISEELKAGRDRSQASQVDAYFRPNATYQFGASYLEKRDTLPRVFTPVLTEYPATPLTVDGLRTWRLAPRGNFAKWVLEPQWIAEQSNDPADGEKQNTYVFLVTKPEIEFKTALMFQEHGSDSLNIDADQAAAVVGSRLGESFTTQIEYKTYQARGRNGVTASDQKGKSFSGQLGLKIDKIFETEKLGQLLFAVTRTHQDGYYLTTSGIDDKYLMGYRLTFTRGPFELRAAACQEPGGLVCSGGVCAQRPPLDGFSVESKVHWNF